MTIKTKPVRIRETVHKKVKVYAAKSETSVIDVLDCALLYFMSEFPPEKFKSNSKTKKRQS